MGNKTLRTAILVAVLLCGQALALVHAFDHPVTAAHADHACLTCGHGHFGSAPPSEAATTLVLLGANDLLVSPLPARRYAAQRVSHPPRAPPRLLV